MHVYKGIRTFNCLTNEMTTWKSILLCVVADQDAKCVITNVKGYRGYWGCSYCEIQGTIEFFFVVVLYLESMCNNNNMSPDIIHLKVLLFMVHISLTHPDMHALGTVI